MKKSFLCAVALAAGCLLPGSAWAHHGDAGRYNEETVTLKGTVVQLVMVNPHALVVFDVNDGGKTTRWTAELGGPQESHDHQGRHRHYAHRPRREERRSVHESDRALSDHADRFREGNLPDRELRPAGRAREVTDSTLGTNDGPQRAAHFFGRTGTGDTT